MTRGGQSHPDAPGPARLLVHPKHAMRIGNVDIMGISETHWIGQGKMQLRDGETMMYSGRGDNIHREGVGILMSKNEAACLMEWTPWNERMIQARFYSKHIKLTIIHIYAPTEDTDE